MNCRACFSPDVVSVIPLGMMPLANGLLKDPCQKEEKYNLEVMVCHLCGLAQLKDLIDPAALFTDYVYFSSHSSTMLASAKVLVDSIIPQLSKDAFVLEIASNDGYLLKNYRAEQISVLGIDPAKNIAEYANEQGIPTRAEFFSAQYADQLVAEGIKADIIHANNVMAHVPDIHSFVSGLQKVLKKTGKIIIEVPYLLDLVEHSEFDTIYHEHVYYFAVKPLRKIFAMYDLEIIDIEKLSLHGGSLRLFIGHAEVHKTTQAAVSYEAHEVAYGLYQTTTYVDLMTRIYDLKNQLKNSIALLKTQGKKIAAYGASAKGATLLNFFDISSSDLAFVVDKSSTKQGLYMPGVKLPIRPVQSLLDEDIDTALLLTWNFAQEILEQQIDFRKKGGTFITPFPQVLGGCHENPLS